MPTELDNKSHSSDRNLIQCFQCNLVSVKLFQCMPCRHSGEWRFSSMRARARTQSQHYSKWTWMVCCMSDHPMPTEQEIRWEPELALALWSKEKSLPLPGIKLCCLSCQSCGLLYLQCYLSSVWYLHPLSCRVHNAANFITRIKNAVK
jgi:hypothetical protein